MYAARHGSKSTQGGAMRISTSDAEPVAGKNRSLGSQINVKENLADRWLGCNKGMAAASF